MCASSLGLSAVVAQADVLKIGKARERERFDGRFIRLLTSADIYLRACVCIGFRCPLFPCLIQQNPGCLATIVLPDQIAISRGAMPQSERRSRASAAHRGHSPTPRDENDWVWSRGHWNRVLRGPGWFRRNPGRSLRNPQIKPFMWTSMLAARGTAELTMIRMCPKIWRSSSRWMNMGRIP